MNIVFRVDASRRIGGGHVMRCLTLANALRCMGARCVFISRSMDGDLSHMLRDAGFEVVELRKARPGYASKSDDVAHASWLEVAWEQDATETSAALDLLFAQAAADWLIFDHYALDERWVKAVGKRRVRRVMALDDIDDRPLGADCLLDQSRLPTIGGRRFSAPWAMIGAEFALLRPEFAQFRQASLSRRAVMDGRRPQLLISTGLMDVGGAALLAVKTLAMLEAEIDVAIGRLAPSAKELVRFAAGRENISVHLDAGNMAELMAAADLGVGAAGATSWERLCLGLPSLLFVIAENQKLIAEGLEAMELAIVLGEPTEQSAGRLLAETTRLISDESALREMAEKSAGACDGIGAERVAAALFRNILPGP